MSNAPQEKKREDIGMPARRYTRGVSWKHRIISVAVLLVLAGLPVAGTVCAVVCDPGAGVAGAKATGSAHHGAGAACREASGSADVQIGAVSEHHCCSRDGSSVLAAALTATRGDAGLVAPLAIARADTTLERLVLLDTESGYSPPAGLAPATSTPVVLRT